MRIEERERCIRCYLLLGHPGWLKPKDPALSVLPTRRGPILIQPL